MDAQRTAGMKRYLQFATGVVTIVVPITATMMFAADVWLRTSAELERYRNVNVTIDVTLDDTVALLLLMALSVAGVIYGIQIVRRSKERPASPNPLGL